MFGKCCLCLQQSELQDSHLLPRALYRLIGMGSDRLHPDTVQLTLHSYKKSSEQARRHILCPFCEQRLNENGERWVLHNCYRGRGRFRLRAELRKRTRLSGAEIEAYAGSKEEVARLGYFCLPTPDLLGAHARLSESAASHHQPVDPIAKRSELVRPRATCDGKNCPQTSENPRNSCKINVLQGSPRQRGTGGEPVGLYSKIL